MLDQWLNVVCRKNQEETETEKLASQMRALPVQDLLEIQKTGSLMGCMKAIDNPSGEDWLDKFKGSPLFDQAIQLEQQSIELEQQMLQMQEQEAQSREQSQAMWRAMDQMRSSERALDLQKRLLLLQLRQAQETPVPPAPPGPTAQPPGMVPEQAEPKIGEDKQTTTARDRQKQRAAKSKSESWAKDLAVLQELEDAEKREAEKKASVNFIGALARLQK